MSQAKSKTLTAREQDQLRARRKAARDFIAGEVADLRAWREERRIQSQKRQAKAAKDRRAAEYGHRGADRVPDRILDAPEAVDYAYQPDPDHPKGPRQVDATLGTSTLPDGRVTTGNYADRRARGARGKSRRLRAREMPAAQARRAARLEA